MNCPCRSVDSNAVLNAQCYKVTLYRSCPKQSI